MNKIYFATGNKDKVQEAQAILDIPIEIFSVELDEVQDLSLETIAKKKVISAYEKVKAPVFVDDVSMEIDVWKNFPGPFIKYLREAGGNELLLYMLRNETNRRAKVIATIGYHDGKEARTFTAVEPGIITLQPRGENSWGFDPIFQPDGSDLTFAEMTTGEKNSRSHRRHALDIFRKHLDSQKV